MQFQPSRTRQRIGLLAATLILSLVFTGVALADAGPHAGALRLNHSQLRDRSLVRGEYVSSLGVASSRLDGLAQVNGSEDQAERDAFIALVSDGRAGVLRGVYVPGVLALRVVQQAPSAAFHVDLTPGVATQFSAASAYGVTGLLADNVASGVLFYSLTPGQDVALIYGDGSLRHYTIQSLYRYQALSPTNPYSDFVDLSSGARVSAATLFSQMYSGGDKVTFQTCLAQDGVLSWGRLFVTATPAE